MKKLDYDFSVKSIESTTINHSERIKKLKKLHKSEMKKVFQYLDETNFGKVLTEYRQNSRVSYHVDAFKRQQDQKHLKAIKQDINYLTKVQIESLLSCYLIPMSYATAFYCIYYQRINKLMKRNLKELIKY